TEPREPPVSGSPGAGAGACPGLSLPEGGTRSPGRWEVARAGLSVSPCAGVPAVPMSPPVPMLRCPRPHGFLSPSSVRVPLAVPLSLCCPCPHGQALSPGWSPVSPRPRPRVWCPHAGLERCQREAEEVAELMRQNVAKALEREGHLEQLQSRAQDLRQASEAFTRTTRSVTRRQRRTHRRWHLVALGLGLLLLFILGLALALGLARSSPGTVTSTVPTPRGGTEHPPSTAGTL
ncbi:VAMP5 protein, partial [Setophaga kirtlandii]|nr:VAMP5 protein [Setophaga kirtlandii]